MSSPLEASVHDHHPTADQVAQWVLARQLQITAYARVIVQDLHLAEDIFQEVCVAAIKACGKFDSAEGTVRWAMKVARNRALDHLRRRKTQASPLSPDLLDKLAEDWIDAISETDDAPYPDTAFERLEECLGTLTPRTRRLLDLRYRHDKKPADIAVLLGQKLQAVYKAITRANSALRTCMNNYSQQRP